MAGQYVLIDYENVQPKNLELLARHPLHVYVFFGTNQTKVTRDFMKSMMALGDKAQIVEISGNGNNALDFHIAYYLGKLASENPKAQFHVISKDKGFDPLIKHLKGKGAKVLRSTNLAEIPALKKKNKTSDEEKIRGIVADLKTRGQSRPSKVSTLQNTINNLFGNKLGEKELDRLVNELANRKFITIDETAVSYALPD